ncbi:MAG: GGDEF domain-containing protein [Edaphobacter sp.]|uniref:GGDEF domain-containing protein n=1 Tax=Edaphobacter sp. TaxID=1934404 RepID=UPI002399933F|nr:diguanylate cyclase [Edaphobacter sp.]MDE1178723.1 GGDEF domain-containing protein [Edaphobacter sp.]
MNRWQTWRYTVAFAVLYVLLNVWLVRHAGMHRLAVTYIFQLTAPWLAFVACCKVVRRSSARVRLYWSMFALALFFWCSGISFAAWDDLTQVNTNGRVASYADLAYYFYGLPILLVIASPTRAERRSLFIWLDGFQALMTGVLVYVTFFSVLPFMHQHEPASITLVTRAYDIENLFLACGVSLRLLALNEHGGTRRFFGVMAAFLWVYAIFASIYNHLYIVLQDGMGAYNSLSAIPFLALCVMLALSLREREEETVAAMDLLDRPVALFIENASPVFYTVALFVLAIVQIPQHYPLGVTMLALALVIYGIRVITLQGRHMRSERELRETRNWLEAMTLQDGLTGIANRRHFDNTLQGEWNRGIRTRQPLSLLLIDIDYFKKLNDTYGHLAGDRCLVELAAALREMVPRSGDLLARYGGEEFAVILTSTDSAGAQLLAGRICSVISGLNVAEPGALPWTITLSIGVATVLWPTVKEAPHELIDEADRALYDAKRNGRNRVEIFQQTSDRMMRETG